MPTITLTALAICLVPVLGVIWIAHRWGGGALEVAYATGRMLAQLIAVGFVLVYIFASDNALVGLAVVALMIGISGIISIRTVKKGKWRALGYALGAIGIAGGLVLVFVLFGVLGLADPWYQPRIIIPLAGMIFSNAMTAVTLAAERFEREQEAGTPYEKARGAAWTAAMIPQINALLAVGLVALPGMMTGQILSGVDPLIAVRYQIVVMAMLLQSCAFAVALFLWFSRPRT